MESNWRFNCWNEGVSTLPFTLCSPLLFPLGYLLTNYPIGNFGPTRTALVRRPDGVWDFGASFFSPTGKLHFPYDLPVDPDH